MSLLDRDKLLTTGRNRQQLATKMFLASETCLRMCEETETVNELVVCMMFNNAILQSICAGDESRVFPAFHFVHLDSNIAIMSLMNNIWVLIKYLYITQFYTSNVYLMAVFRLSRMAPSGVNGQYPLSCGLT
jgi:hypothetical protein